MPKCLWLFIGVACGLLTLAVCLRAAPERALTDEEFTRWSAYIRPSKEEARWQEIAWRPTFWEAVVEGQRTEKPILVWAMNGHPLACT